MLILAGPFIQEKGKFLIYLEIKEQLFVELLIMYLHRLLWVISTMKWLMYGVLEFYVMNYALDMLHSNLPKAVKKHTGKY